MDRRTRVGFIALGWAALLAASPSPAADVYKWVDEQGKVHYGDRPAGKDASKLDIKQSGPAQAPEDAYENGGALGDGAADDEGADDEAADDEGTPPEETAGGLGDDGASEAPDDRGSEWEDFEPPEFDDTDSEE